DLRIWPGPGSDRDLNEVWGGELQEALDTERTKMGVEVLEVGEIARIHPGRLHCDFLAWVATREPESGTSRNSAPDEDALRQAVLSVLSYVAERSVERIAFPALGSGPSEVSPEDRLAVIVRAAHEYEEACYRDGRQPVVEVVLVCEPSASVLKKAQQRVAKLAKSVEPPKRTAEEKKTTRKRATSRKKEPAKPVLDPADVEQHRTSAAAYSMQSSYIAGDWILHSKFGVGRVEGVDGPNAMTVLFEGGDTRRMVHGRV
ncbi:MAG: macro domain-containing protein, partial [Myxococcota bacterium]